MWSQSINMHRKANKGVKEHPWVKYSLGVLISLYLSDSHWAEAALLLFICATFFQWHCSDFIVLTESDFFDTGLSSADELKRTLVGSVSQDFLLGKFSTWHESCEAFYEDPHITVVRWTVFPKSKNIPGTVSKSVIALVVSGTGVLAAQAGRSATHAAGQVLLAAAPCSVGALTGQQRQHLVYPGGAAECWPVCR